jgi:photosystem II stability/assembly factor-like uncharacterized protein
LIAVPYSVKHARWLKALVYSIILLYSIVGTVNLTVSLETYVREPMAIWEELENPWRDTGEGLFDIAFLNSSHGWATGKGAIGTGIGEKGGWGVVLQTKDGGDTWALSYSNQSIRLKFIEIVDSDTVWIATSRGLLNTSDGGRTWYMDHSKSGSSPTVAFKNSTHGWTNINQELLYTVDGGHIWKPVQSWSFDAGLFQIRFIGEQLMWAGGLDGIYHSQDGGQTWTQQSNTTTLGLAIVSETEGWACYSSWYFSHMIDGQYWIEKHPPSRTSYSWTPSHYRDLEFINPKQGWMVGSTVGVAYTPDGGLNWYEQRLPSGWSSLRAVDFINETHGWAVGRDGNIYRTRTGNQYGRRLVGAGYVIRKPLRGGWVIPSSTVACVILVAFGGIASLQLLERYLKKRKAEPLQASLRIQW